MRHGVGETHAPVARRNCLESRANAPLGGALNRTAKFDDDRNVRLELGHGVRQHLYAFDHIEAPDVSDDDRSTRAAAMSFVPAIELHADTEPVDGHVSIGKTVRLKNLPGAFRQHHEAVGRCKQLPLPFDVAANDIAHSDRGAKRARHTRGELRDRGGHVRDRPRECPRHATSVQHARGAFLAPRDTVARLLAPLHQRSARADEAKAARVGRDNRSCARRFRCTQLRQTHACHERVHVDDVGTLDAEPPVKALSAANGLTALRFSARRLGGDRVAVNGRPIVAVRALALSSGIRRGNEDLMARARERAA